VILIANPSRPPTSSKGHRTESQDDELARIGWARGHTRRRLRIESVEDNNGDEFVHRRTGCPNEAGAPRWIKECLASEATQGSPEDTQTSPQTQQGLIGQLDAASPC
jgi:hypothetical protein